MRHLRAHVCALLTSLLLLAGLAVPAAAQEETSSGQLLELVTFRPQPAHAAAWTDAVRGIVEAAEQANLAPSYGWIFYQEDIFRYRLVYPVANMAYYDDPMQWMRQFSGTPGERRLQQAFEAMGEAAAELLDHEVIEHVHAWSRGEHDPATQPLAHVDEVWVKAGAEQAFDAAARELVAILEELDYPYPVQGYRPRIGTKAYIVIFFDSREAFYGPNDLFRLIEERGLGERWGAFVGSLSEAILDASHYDSHMLPELSYMP